MFTAFRATDLIRAATRQAAARMCRSAAALAASTRAPILTHRPLRRAP